MNTTDLWPNLRAVLHAKKYDLLSAGPIHASLGEKGDLTLRFGVNGDRKSVHVPAEQTADIQSEVDDRNATLAAALQ